jgi:hypothetical protein
MSESSQLQPNAFDYINADTKPIKIKERHH